MMMPWQKLEYAGWGFYSVTAVVLSIPGAWLGYLYGGEDLQPMGRLFLGVFIAGIVAAFITAGANALIQTTAARREHAAQEAAQREADERKLERKLRRKEKKQQRTGNK